jgi:hypothetical protein
MNEICPNEAGIGHNNPPSRIEEVNKNLKFTHSALEGRGAELLEACERVPDVQDDDTAGKAADFIKQVTACIKTAEATRKDAKEPSLAEGRAIDGFFKAISEPLLEAKKKIDTNLSVFLRKKEAEERRKREEEARIAEEARKKAEAEAREAERKRKAAEYEKEQAEEKARKAEEARKQAEIERKAAEDRADAEEKRRIESERKAEKQKKDQLEKDKKATARKAEKATKVADDTTKNAEKIELKATRRATAPAAELSRTRGEYGAVSSLRTFWDFTVDNYDVIPLETIRQHISREAIDKAIRSAIAADIREIRGVHIFENNETVTR